MIQHTILFKVKAYTTTDSIQTAINHFLDLKNNFPGIIAIIAGECIFHDEKSTHFFTEGISHVISIDFKDQEALNKFFADPMTEAAKIALVNISEGGYNGIVGFDFINLC